MLFFRIEHSKTQDADLACFNTSGFAGDAENFPESGDDAVAMVVEVDETPLSKVQAQGGDQRHHT